MSDKKISAVQKACKQINELPSAVHAFDKDILWFEANEEADSVHVYVSWSDSKYETELSNSQRQFDSRVNKHMVRICDDVKKICTELGLEFDFESDSGDIHSLRVIDEGEGFSVVIDMTIKQPSLDKAPESVRGMGR